MLRLAAPAFQLDRRELARRIYPNRVEQAYKTGIANQVYLVARAGHGGADLRHAVFGNALRPRPEDKGERRKGGPSHSKLPGSSTTAANGPWPHNRTPGHHSVPKKTDNHPHP